MSMNRSSDSIGGSVDGMGKDPNEKANLRRQMTGGLFEDVNGRKLQDSMNAFIASFEDPMSPYLAQD